MNTIKVNCDKKFIFCLTELSKTLGFTLGEAERIINCEKAGKGINVCISGNVALVKYERDCDFVRAFTLALQYLGQDKEISCECDIERMGTMLTSADTVLKVDYVKKFIRNSAMLGYNFLQLYMESTYEIPDEPFFGYKRGKYSQSELKEIVEYGKKFFVEIVPAIQTLGHLQDIFKWPKYKPLFDVERAILVNYEDSYILIEKMLKSLSECFDTDRINLGMDEAYWIGTGRYHWFVDDSRPDMAKLFIKHLKRVISIAEKYGFSKPSIWADQLIGYYAKGYIDPPEEVFTDFPEDIKAEFPKNVNLIYWHYAVDNSKDFDRYIDITRRLSPNVSFASIAYNLGSFATYNRRSEPLVDTACRGCKENNINELVVTLWSHRTSHDNVLSSLYAFVERSAKCIGYDFEERFKFLFGYSYTEFNLLDMPNMIEGNSEGIQSNPSFYIISEDLLLGISSKHIPKNADKKYLEFSAMFGKLADRDSEYAYLFKFEKELCDFLAVKCNLSNDIKDAYDKKDMNALKLIADKLPSVCENIKAFHSAYYEFWRVYAKDWGWERYDDYFGGMIMRFYTTKKYIEDFISGKSNCIPKLDEERLALNESRVGKPINISSWEFNSNSFVQY